MGHSTIPEPNAEDKRLSEAAIRNVFARCKTQDEAIKELAHFQAQQSREIMWLRNLLHEQPELKTQVARLRDENKRLEELARSRMQSLSGARALLKTARHSLSEIRKVMEEVD